MNFPIMKKSLPKWPEKVIAQAKKDKEKEELKRGHENCKVQN